MVYSQPWPSQHDNEDNYLPDLQENIVVEHMVDPRYFRDTLNSHMGSAFSVEPTLTQSAWFRPHNRSEDFENLYFVGAGTHPGAGLPGVLSSSKIAESLIAGERVKQELPSGSLEFHPSKMRV